MYEDMSYFALKTECAKQGMSAKGRREDLIDKLNNKGLPIDPIELEKAEEKRINEIIDLKQLETTEEDDRLQQFLPQATFKPAQDLSKYAPWLTEQRLKELADKLHTISAGRGSWEYQINNREGSYQVQFSGKILGVHSTTLIDTDNQILRVANWYFNSRMVAGKNGQASVM